MKNIKLKIILTGFIGSLGGLLFGLSQGFTNGSLKYIIKELDLSTIQVSHFASIMLYGCVIGSVLGGFISRLIGRKNTLVLTGGMFIAFILSGAISNNILIIFTSRFFQGIAVGLVSFTAPVYLSEIAPKDMRGGIVSLYQLMIATGILMIFVSNAFIGYYLHNWHIMLGIIVIPASVMLICNIFLPKSPRWLILKERIKDSKKVLSKIRYNDDASNEIEEIKTSLQTEKVSISLLLRKQYFLKVLLLGITLQFINSVCGINAVLYFSTIFFHNAGVENAATGTVIVGLVFVLSTLIAIQFIDRIGRKPILYFGLFGMCLTTSIIAFNFYYSEVFHGVYACNVIMVSSTVLYIFFYGVSLGPIIWAICPEIFPLECRDTGVTITTMANWIFNSIVIGFSLIILHVYGGTLLFILFAITCTSGLFVVYFFVPETKGVSLEEIELKLKSGVRLKNIGKV